MHIITPYDKAGEPKPMRRQCISDGAYNIRMFLIFADKTLFLHKQTYAGTRRGRLLRGLPAGFFPTPPETLRTARPRTTAS